MDASSEVELRCLTGSDGVSEIADTVAYSRDYGLLERLVTAVSSKDMTLFSVKTCQKLLLMILQSKDEVTTHRIDIVKKTLIGLSSSQDPDVPLWNSILSAVTQFGWTNLSQSVTSLLNRKIDSSQRYGFKSKITLKVCLNRVEFILNLYHDVSEAKVQNCFDIDVFIDDLKKNTDNNSVSEEDMKEVATKIKSLVARFGWESMSNIVKHSLAFVSKNAKDRWYGISSTLVEGELVMKVHTINDCNITQDALRRFAVKFALVLQKSSYEGFTGAKQTLFLKCIQLLLKYGEQKELDAAGKAFVSHAKVISAMLKVLSGSSNEDVDSQSLLRDILNKCLVQQHTPAQGGWEKELVSNNKGLIIVPPSPMHIYKILKACPNLVSVADEQDRHTLHYAAGSSTASYETIECIFQADQKSASVRDPISGLYPFMAAGSNGNTSASFELLRASPNLVVGGTHASVDDEENEKKRKRI